MIFWIIIFFIAIIIICFLSVTKFTITNDEIQNEISVEDIPTIHARCRNDIPCGGDLICDLQCKRCKSQINGNCSGDVDCESGLQCHNWKCVPQESIAISEDQIIPIDQIDFKDEKISGTKIKWNPTPNIFYI